MVASYRDNDGIGASNAEQEVCQKITLAGLHRGGFFTHAASQQGQLGIWSNEYFLKLADMIRFTAIR